MWRRVCLLLLVVLLPFRAWAIDLLVAGSGTVSLATGLALTPTPTLCGAGIASRGIDTTGNAAGCFTPGNVVTSGTPVDNQIAVWLSATQLEGTPALTYSAGTLGLGAVGTLGKFTLAGNTSGVITLQPQAVAGTFNWNYPVTAGTAGQVLRSQGGGATAMDWLTLAASATTDTTNATNITTGTLPVAVIGAGTLTYAKIQNVSATARLLGRSTAGAGPIEELSAAQAKTVLALVSTDLSDSGTLALKAPASTQTLTLTRVTPRILSHGDVATITVDCDDYDQVVVGTMTTFTTYTLAAPSTCTPTNGQYLTYVLTSGVAKILVLTPGTNGFSDENGIALPTTTIAGRPLVITTRWNATTQRWALTEVTHPTPKVTTFANGTTTLTPDCNTTDLVRIADLTQTLAIALPTCTPRDGQSLQFAICSSTSQTLSWDGGYSTAYNIDLPTTTTGSGKCDLIGFKRNATTPAWNMVATTQNPATNRRRICPLIVGDESPGAPALTDAQIIQTYACPVYGGGTIEQISIRAMGAFQPSVMVHRRTGITNTALLSAPLQTGTNGAVACAKTTAVTGLEGVTCSATVIGANATMPNGDVTLGVTSGTSGGAPNFLVTVTYLQ